MQSSTDTKERKIKMSSHSSGKNYYWNEMGTLRSGNNKNPHKLRFHIRKSNKQNNTASVSVIIGCACLMRSWEVLSILRNEIHIHGKTCLWEIRYKERNICTAMGLTPRLTLFQNEKNRLRITILTWYKTQIHYFFFLKFLTDKKKRRLGDTKCYFSVMQSLHNGFNYKIIVTLVELFTAQIKRCSCLEIKPTVIT